MYKAKAALNGGVLQRLYWPPSPKHMRPKMRSGGGGGEGVRFGAWAGRRG